jgi:uncharacterized protein YggL (DUF469 family)
MQLFVELRQQDMRRRLRKKRRVGEFQEFGFDVTYTSSAELSASDRDRLLDAFIEQAIEANGLACGGGGFETMEFFVTRMKCRTSATETDRLVVQRWLESCLKVVSVKVGELRDSWYNHA